MDLGQSAGGPGAGVVGAGVVGAGVVGAGLAQPPRIRALTINTTRDTNKTFFNLPLLFFITQADASTNHINCQYLFA